MAEISYPFAEASAGGGSPMVSQAQWQSMAHLWGEDRIDFRLTSVGYTAAELPFDCEIVGGDIVVKPGSAFVGGFYYKNDANWTHAAPTNSNARARMDTVMLRADLVAGSVNFVIVEGAYGLIPKAPVPQRSSGVWEMPVWNIELQPNNGARALQDVRRYDGPGTVWVPWNATYVTDTMSPGNFAIDMDNNQNANDTQAELYRGRDGSMITRLLGKRRPYTPDIFTVSNKPAAANRNGYHRYIAPGTISFTAEISNTTTKVCAITSSWYMGLTLPYPSSKNCTMHLTGLLYNPEKRDGVPNFVSVIGETDKGTKNLKLFMQDPAKLSEGLNGLSKIPGKSTLTISGVYETNDFDTLNLS